MTITSNELSPADHPDPRRSVFINCPFDIDYQPLFDAIIFAVVASGYTPRSALETGSVSVPRVKQIVTALNSSRYSIHDLSRCKGEGDDNIARFNMPLEFGMAFGKNHIDEIDRNVHDWLVLLPENHLYRRCISDLGGYDPRTHDNSIKSVVQPVMAWLVTRSGAPPNAGVAPVLAAFPEFQAAIKLKRDEWGPHVPWKHIIDVARQTAEGAKLLTITAPPAEPPRRPPRKPGRRSAPSA